MACVTGINRVFSATLSPTKHYLVPAFGLSCPTLVPPCAAIQKCPPSKTCPLCILIARMFAIVPSPMYTRQNPHPSISLPRLPTLLNICTLLLVTLLSYFRILGNFGSPSPPQPTLCRIQSTNRTNPVTFPKGLSAKPGHICRIPASCRGPHFPYLTPKHTPTPHPVAPYKNSSPGSTPSYP